MNLLILGSGGREHTLAWKIAQSENVHNIFIAPGNAGTMNHGFNVNLNLSDFSSIGSFALKEKIGIVLVGPEDPLVAGIHDYFLERNDLRDISVIGPQKAGAMLEGSKDFAKAFMGRHSIPTAAYRTFDQESSKYVGPFLESLTPPFVLKADGLAAGKGVLIIDSLENAIEEAAAMLSGKFGVAGRKLVIEQYLEGIEMSAFVITDGKSFCLLPSAKDYKRIGEGDTGPNTGGMGTVSDVPFADETFMQKVQERIISPTVFGLQKEGIPYKGFIFFGLMNVSGNPYVIEYNARLGDPEAESIIPRIRSDFFSLIKGVADVSLNKCSIEIDPRYTATVMLVSGGYPGAYEKGKAISGLDSVEGSLVFHAGTVVDKDTGLIVTDGGRVMGITSFGANPREAFGKSFRNAERVNFEGKNYRKDLGQDLEKYV